MALLTYQQFFCQYNNLMPIYFNYAHYFHYFNEYSVCNHKSDILRYCKHLQMAFTKRGDAFNMDDFLYLQLTYTNEKTCKTPKSQITLTRDLTFVKIWRMKWNYCYKKHCWMDHNNYFARTCNVTIGDRESVQMLLIALNIPKASFARSVRCAQET